jgi:hypothetical protein
MMKIVRDFEMIEEISPVIDVPVRDYRYVEKVTFGINVKSHRSPLRAGSRLSPGLWLLEVAWDMNSIESKGFLS